MTRQEAQDTLCPRCEGLGNTGTWRGIVYKCRHCEGTGRVPVVSGWRPHEPEAIPVAPEQSSCGDDLERDYLLLCYQERLDTIQYDLNHAIESDAYASYVPCLDEHTVFVDPVAGDGSGFSVTPREARVLAARLIRAANMADFGSQTWKFKTLEGVECVNLNTDSKGRKVEP